MMPRIPLLALFAGVSLLQVAAVRAAPPPPAASPVRIHWLHSEQAAFRQAQREQRFVVLDLEAVWCHWCHVMDEMTYANPQVIAEMRAHYVTLRVDQDARPDLAQRYGDWGWPATIFFAADGTEIVKKRGYIPPAGMLQLLRAIVADPSPVKYAGDDEETMAATSDSLDHALRDELGRRYVATFDAKQGGLDLAQKFLDHDSIEYALVLARAGANDQAARAKLGLDRARALLDPAWGGFYQYSTDGDWAHPHFEKLAALQGQYLRSYALGYAALDRDPAYAGTVQSVVRYLDTFLRNPEGAFYTSQDADLRPGTHSGGYFALDDKSRRAQGLPRVDRHIYSSCNGSIIEGLAMWAEVSGDAHAREEARTAARWILAHRAIDGGGFRHGEEDPAGPYLGDTLAMGRAFLALYRADADRAWLMRADAAAAFIEEKFRRAGGGYVTAVGRSVLTSAPAIDENIALARWTNLLASYSGHPAQTAMARHAMRWLNSRATALHNATQPGILLADRELAQPALHLTVVGGKDDPAARGLFRALQALPSWYKRIEWWDRAEGPLPNPDVPYPPVKRAAAFVCTDRRCSLPLYDVEAMRSFLAAGA
ncbi:MAG TPA: DUF255 domain-containing protein [Rhodanobacteraceae bacterium]|nr:DUF255 domain-containing protein [Rhodanobacteraceae bacterium]